MLNDLELDDVILDARLVIHRFEWNLGNHFYEIEFDTGLNLISQLDQNQRTVILRLIRYALGGPSERINQDIQDTTDYVSLTLTANQFHIITKRSFQHPSGKFSIRVNGEEQQITPLDMGKYLLTLMNLPVIYVQAGENRPQLTFNDLARTFVVDRDISYSEILAKMAAEPRRQTVKLMLGLTTQAIADVEEALTSTEQAIKKLQDEISGITRMLSDFQVGTISEIEERQNAVRSRIEEIELQESDLRRSIENDSAVRSKVGGEYDALREQYLDLRGQQQELDSDLQLLSQQIQEKTDLRDILQEEVDKLERRDTSTYVLSSYTFSRCPRCLREIDNDMRAREEHGHCMLCERPFQEKDEIDEKVWRRAIRDAQDAVKEASQLISSFQLKQDAALQTRRIINEQLRQMEGELTRQTKQYVSPLLEDISLLNERRISAQRELFQLELERRQREYINNFMDDVLPNKKRDLENLQEQLAELQRKRSRPSERQEIFLTHFRSFMRGTASRLFRDASWDDIELLPLVNQQRYIKSMSGPDLAICILAFHYALLAIRVDPRDGIDTAHPRLLIIDEPDQQNMSSKQYRRILENFRLLAESVTNEVQIIIAVTDSDGFEEFSRPILKTDVQHELPEFA